jgi:exonuclease III
MKLISLNITGLENKIGHINHYLPRCDVLALQETHTTNINYKHNEWILNQKWHCVWSHGTSASKGVAILLSKTTFPLPPTSTINDAEGRWVWCEVSDYTGKKMAFASVYAPTVEKENAQFLLQTRWCFPPDTPVMVGGDWNLTRRATDRQPTPAKWKSSASTRAFKDLLTRHELEDSTPKDAKYHTC